MIVSGEQTQLAARYAEPLLGSPGGAPTDIPPELMSRIVSAIDAAPETRADRVFEAKDRLTSVTLEPREIARMIIARTICDALR